MLDEVEVVIDANQWCQKSLMSKVKQSPEMGPARPEMEDYESALTKRNAKTLKQGVWCNSMGQPGSVTVNWKTINKKTKRCCVRWIDNAYGSKGIILGMLIVRNCVEWTRMKIDLCRSDWKNMCCKSSWSTEVKVRFNLKRIKLVELINDSDQCGGSNMQEQYHPTTEFISRG